jgi:hypothetical protein
MLLQSSIAGTVAWLDANWSSQDFHWDCNGRQQLSPCPEIVPTMRYVRIIPSCPYITYFHNLFETKISIVRFQVLMAESMKMTAFFDIASWFLVELGRHLYVLTAFIIRAMHGAMFQKCCNHQICSSWYAFFRWSVNYVPIFIYFWPSILVNVRIDGQK